MTGTARELAVEALATALAGDHGPSYWPGLMDVTIIGETPDVVARHILAHLPPGWRLVNEEDVARRLHETYLLPEFKGRYGDLSDGDVCRAEARRLLGVGGECEHIVTTAGPDGSTVCARCGAPTR